MKYILKDVANYYKQNEKEIGVGIFLVLIGVVITSLVYPPIASNIVQFILTILGFINQNIQDYYYSEMVRYANSLVSWVQLQFVAILYLIIIVIMSPYRILKSLLFHFKGKTYEFSELMDIENNLSKNKTTTNKKMEKKKFFSEKYILLTIGSLWIILFVIVLFSIHASLLINIFERQTLQLTPYIHQEKVTELKIEWTYINSKADYDSLNSKINSYFKEFNIPEK